MSIQLSKWNIEAITGYKPITTFWEDFSIADLFGLEAVRDTYKRAFAEWKTNYKYITELVMVLNHKCWEHYNTQHIELSELYGNLYYQLDEWVFDNLKGEELDYYIEITD